MMVEEPFAGADGRFLTMPPRNVVPKPVQKPHPPLWVACSRRETIRLAAEKGIGALSFSFVEPEEAKAWVDEYHAIVDSERCVPGGFAVNPQVGVRAADDVRARRGAGHRARHRRRALLRLLAGPLLRLRRPPPGRTNIYEEFLARRDDVGFARSIITADAAPLGVRVLQQGLGSLRGAIGSPEQVRDLCRRYEAAGVDQLIFVMQAGRNRHEHICESIELFAAEVMPEFAAARRRRRRARAPSASPPRSRPRWRAASRRASADPDYTIAPVASGPPAASRGASARRPTARPRRVARAGAAGRAGRARLQGLRAALRRSPPRAHRGLGPRAEGALRRDGAGLRARQGRGLQRRAAVRPAPRRRRARAAGRSTLGPERASVRPGTAQRAGADAQARASSTSCAWPAATSTPARRCSPAAWTWRATWRSPRGWARCSASPGRPI